MKFSTIVKAAPAVMLSAALVLVAGCGSSGSSSSGSTSPSSSPSMNMPMSSAPQTAPAAAQVPAGAVQVGLSEYKFTPSPIKAKAGDVKLYLVNEGTVNHDLAIKLSSGWKASPQVAPGQKLVWDAGTLKPGTYKVECTVPGHASMGMVATLIVS